MIINNKKLLCVLCVYFLFNDRGCCCGCCVLHKPNPGGAGVFGNWSNKLSTTPFVHLAQRFLFALKRKGEREREKKEERKKGANGRESKGERKEKERRKKGERKEKERRKKGEKKKGEKEGRERRERKKGEKER